MGKTVEEMMDSLFAVEEHIAVIYGIMDDTIRKTTGDLESIYAKEFR